MKIIMNNSVQCQALRIKQWVMAEGRKGMCKAFSCFQRLTKKKEKKNQEVSNSFVPDYNL